MLARNNAEINRPMINNSARNSFLRNTFIFKIQVLSMVALISIISLEWAIGFKYFEDNQSCYRKLLPFPTWLLINAAVGFKILLSIFIYLYHTSYSTGSFRSNLENNSIPPNKVALVKILYKLIILQTLFNMVWWFIGAIIFGYYCYNYLNEYLIIMGYIVLASDFIKLACIIYNH